MTSPPANPPANPAWDPQVRWLIQHALDTVCRAAADVLRRHANNPHHAYEAPSEVTDGGDVHGLIGSGRLEVLEPLAAALAAARQQITAVETEIDTFQRARYGEGWQPAGRPGVTDPPAT